MTSEQLIALLVSHAVVFLCGYMARRSQERRKQPQTRPFTATSFHRHRL